MKDLDFIFEIMQKTPLFRGIRREEAESLLTCLKALRRQYKAGESILAAGEPVTKIGVLLAGQAQVIREDRSGNRTIIAMLTPGELFAEAFACAAQEQKILPVTVQAAADSQVLLLDYRRLVAACPDACLFHARLIENMLAVLADKNLTLNRRLGHLSQRTTREKLLSYLAEQARISGSSTFTVPFDRQELADYLCTDRSALSAVLSSLRREGVLDYSKNRFTLHGPGF